MATKIKYYQVEDYASMTADRQHLEKFGYKAQGMKPVGDRDAVEVTYYRDDSKAGNAKLAEYEIRYDDAKNAIAFAEAYESFDPNKCAPKRISMSLLALGVLGIIICGLFLVAMGGLGGVMLLKPEVAESFLGENARAIINGESVIIDRSFSFDLQGALDFVGIEAITWDFIAKFLLAVGAVFGVAVVLIIVMLIRSKIARVNYNKSENLRYQARLDICQRAAKNARAAISQIDAELAKSKKKTT